MVCQVLLVDEDGGVGVPKDMFDLGRLEQGVHRHEDSPRQRHTEGGLDPFGPVAHEQRHSGALARTRGGQRLGEAPGTPPELRVTPAHDIASGRRAGGMEAQRFAPAVSGHDLGEQSPHGGRADPGLGLSRWPCEDGHEKGPRARAPSAVAYAGSSTSTGPFAITDPSWLVIVTSKVTRPAPRTLS